MKWIAKAALQKALSGLPGGERVNYLLQRRLTHGLPRGRAEIAEKFRCAAQYLGLARRFGDWGGGPVRAYEFGCGWELAVAQALYLLGVERQVVVDLRPLLNWELVADAGGKLAAIAGELAQAGFSLPRDPAGPPPASRADLRTRLGIAYQAPLDARATGLPAGSFDLIHSTEVLEHLPEPAGMLGLFDRMLRPDGLLLLSLPNDGNPLQDAARELHGLPPWWIAPPHHLNYFTIASITALLTRQGFSPLHVQASFPMEFFLLMGENYVGDPALGRICHGRRKTFETALAAAGLGALKTKLYEQFAALGLGRTVQILARRVGPDDKERQA